MEVYATHLDLLPMDDAEIVNVSQSAQDLLGVFLEDILVQWTESEEKGSKKLGGGGGGGS